MGALGAILAPIVERLLLSLFKWIGSGLAVVAGKAKTEWKVYQSKGDVDDQLEALKQASEQIHDGQPATPEQRAEKYRRLRDLVDL